MSQPYSGAKVSHTFRERWRSANMIGDARPVCTVEVRRGRLHRTFHDYAKFGYPVFGDYPGALGQGFWYPDWEPDGDWRLLDGVKNVQLTQSFDNNGVCAATITMDNIALIPTTGHAGILYHVVKRGYYSPLRGYVGPGRPDPGVGQTPFMNTLPNAQIRVRQGYGTDAMVTTFLGLIDDVESDSVPNQISITARDFGGVLVDQVFFGWAKEMLLPSPVTFANRSMVEGTQLVGGDAQASSAAAGYDAGRAIAGPPSQGWRSRNRSSKGALEWIEVTVPSGRYSQIFLGPGYDNMEVYIGIKPAAAGAPGGVGHLNDGNAHPTFNGNDITGQLDSNGWWDPYTVLSTGSQENGGWPYFAIIAATQSGPGDYVSLGGEFETGDGTVLRLGFSNLGRAPNGKDFCAAVNEFQVNEQTFRANAVTGRYVLIDDVADVVRCVLRWAGFKNWEVENTGVDFGLGGVYVATDAMSFMDVINTIKEMVGWTFFIGEPRDDNDNQDLGWPIFRNNRVMEDDTGPTEFIDDSLLLTDAKVTISNADDHCIIRARGIAKDDGAIVQGSPDSVHRIMFSYIPAWSTDQGHSQAGVLKPITHVDHLYTRLSDCQFACYLIALQIAMLKYTAIIDLPGTPAIGLDTMQSVIDRTQGLNSRVYVANRTSTMELGSDGSWTLEIGGALIDTAECTSVLGDYRAALKQLQSGEPSPWLRKRHGTVLEAGYQVGGSG